ncbi:DUF4373 domain-containing protein [Pedobacter sp. Hv1]|uniref:DUF4373 domain-containing protein n=1 Tax=Pedobacter sp. Hv1 TaxID=1740090 RepID=UPI0006D8B7C8|nr:DUF4373 domain-containing protein [Pedobacter sp. Hv1]KQC02068.1 hypothetical protein AQF98_00400 [Pedobacter sp. Hv1]
MARPKKDNADYFSHDKDMRNDPKIRALRKKFKNGYSVFNMLLEVLTGSDFFFIEINEMEIELLAGDFDEEAEILTQIIDYCVKVKLLFREENQIYSCGLKKRLQPVIDNRNAVKQRFLDKKLKQEVVSKTPSTQSKVKYSKVKESIDNNSNYYPTTPEVVAEVEVINSIKIEKKISEEKQHELPIDFVLDEEEFVAAEKFLKGHSIFNLVQMQHGTDPTTTLTYFRVFYEQKKAFGELKNKQPVDVLKHFYQWIPKYKRVLTDKNQINEQFQRSTAFKSTNTVQPAKAFGKL